ncbi:inositol monophosphatase [Anaeromyxobacter sp. K]|uniref:inositol monophosphatase family protein n=1 Tax=Anaeromyxobacter sp. (strain K) TaxID=447217 RepID=UPI00015F854B|nr:inositol monophosphatase family protein [Anaeromyxobacter sp. K]ACG71702.1 inositol monophosphatase [Anaeromyxobacter sp. K]
MTDLSRALEAALRAARAAADLLRAELFRAGGPRGEPGHCPADEEAEDLIRAVLDAEFPGDGLVGEERPERNRPPALPGGRCWLVDPNDGTADFQRGHRGAAVSIGLVQGGVPVLGVVLAHTAPHGGEDLLAWAEGQGPVRRNGAPLPPMSAAPLRAGDVVLVSSSAAKRARGNAEAVQPARFRPLTSIAYRLALVATGDARGAISLHRPRALDIAAGHALVRGAGGVLLDEAGREVRYGPAGEGRVAFCFGGAPPVAARLASRSWVEAQAYGPGAPGLCAPLAGRAVRDDGLLRRGQGALLGQFAGDALGGQVEFSGPARIAATHPGGVRDLADGGHWSTLAGQPTDDSELALALARTVIAFGRFDAARVAEAYADWLGSEPFDVGRTVDAALRPALRLRAAGAGAEQVAEAARAAASRGSLANGALMRVSPLGIAGHASPAAEVAAWARADAALTHPAAPCQDASAVFAATVAFAIATGASAAEVADRGEALAAELGCGPEVREALAAARTGPPEDFETSAGLVTIALQNAFFQLRHAPDLEAGLVDTVGRGGDTDTNAAIAGALLGAVHGVLAVPERWRRAVLSCWPVEGAPGVRRPRPPVCWPGDALILAERLLGL